MKEQLEQLDKLLDEYEQGKVGLPALQINPQAQHYMNLTQEQLNKLAPDECGEGAVLLNSMALHVQRSFNKEMSRVKKAEAAITKIIVSILQQYNAPSAQERRELAIANNEAASKWLAIRDYAAQRAERLNFVASSIKNTAVSLDNLQRTKLSMRQR